MTDLLIWFYFLVSFLLLPYGYNCLLLTFTSRKYRAEATPKLVDYPTVTVQLPIFNERYVVNRLIQSASRLNYRHDRLQILVLDDSTDDTTDLARDEVERLRKGGFDIELIRRSNREGFKAGALQNALKYTRGKYVAVFDADFVPAPDFLLKLIPHLEEEPTVGFVQARWGHMNRGYNKLTETIALGIDGHFIVEQSGRNAASFLVNFNGSGGVLRTEAINDVGGWHSDTLTEDLDISYRMQMKGWKPKYIRDVTVPGEIPVSIPAFKNQQGRWACGSIQCARKLLKDLWLSARFSIAQKVQATIHLTYYLIHPLMLLMLFSLVLILHFNSLSVLPLFLPLIILFTICGLSTSVMYLSSMLTQGTSLRNKFPYLGLLAVVGYGLTAHCSISILKGIKMKGGEFVRTPKYNIRSRGDDWASKIYKPLNSSPLFEIILATYSFYGIILSLEQRFLTITLFLLLYFIGYLFITYYTLSASR